jgi:hypothetical protein
MALRQQRSQRSEIDRLPGTSFRLEAIALSYRTSCPESFAMRRGRSGDNQAKGIYRTLQKKHRESELRSVELMTRRVAGRPVGRSDESVISLLQTQLLISNPFLVRYRG